MNVFEKTRALFPEIQPNELVLEMFNFIEKNFGTNRILRKWKPVYLTDFINNLGRIIVNIKKNQKAVYIGNLKVNDIAGILAYYLQDKYNALEDNWDLLDQVIRSYNDEKAKTQQLPCETDDDFKKRVIATQINRINKLRELERERQYLKTKYSI